MADHAPTEVRVLGPLEVTRDGTLVVIPRGLESALLEWLVLHRDRGVSVDATAAALWPGAGRQQSRESLRGCLSRLRRRVAVAGRSGVERSLDGRLTLDIGEAVFDLDEFEVLRKRAFAALQRERIGATLPLLIAALARWRGDAYGWLADTEAGLAEAVRLHELRADTEEARTAVLVCTGQVADAVATLWAAVERDPMRERAWRLLMTALAIGGRRGEALRAYQRCRSALADVGATPSPATVGLEHRVLSDTSIDPGAVLAEEFAAPSTRTLGDVRPGPPEQLEAAWREIGDGARFVVTPSIGVESALASLRAAVEGDAGLLLQVEGDRNGGGSLDALADALERTGFDDARLSSSLRAWPAGDPDDLDIAVARHRTLSRLADAIASACQHHPVCLVLHRRDPADGTLLSVARFVADTLDAAPVLVAVVDHHAAGSSSGTSGAR